MRDLYLLNYNNYENRIIKREEDLIDYEDYLCADIARGINFIPGNGITTKVIINSKYFNEDSSPDYMLVVKDQFIIESRWFVLNCTRTTNGQYKLDLKRDTVADNLKLVMSDKKDKITFNIKRGYVPNSDAAIYNREGFVFNQIKKEEFLLKDYTEMPWIVGYISADVAKDSTEDITGNIEGYFDSEYTKIEQYPYYKYKDIKCIQPDNIYVKTKFDIEVDNANDEYNRAYLKIFAGPAHRPDNIVNRDWEVVNGHGDIVVSDINVAEDIASKWSKSNLATPANRKLIVEALRGASNSIKIIEDTNEYNLLKAQNGRVLKVDDGLYKVKVDTLLDTKVSNVAIGTSLDKLVQGALFANEPGVTSFYYGNKDYADQIMGPGNITLETAYQTILRIEKVSDQVPSDTTFKFSFSGVDVSNPETPYGILCMPYIDGWKINNETNSIDKEGRLKIFQALGTTANLLYDIQLLPYCPIKNLLIDKANKTIQTKGPKVDIKSNDGVQLISSFFVAKTSSLSFSIDVSNVKFLELVDKKIQNETEVLRLCSPNYSGIFEFNVAMFDKSIKTINVDVNFKPYSPYIHVAPQWSGLYGKDFNDARGLICGGDWSIDRISDNWETYQYNNKNFQLSFDRQIETMELHKKWGMRSAIGQGAINAIGNAASLGLIGSSAGLVGAGIGAGIGAVSGAFDTTYNVMEQYALGQDAINAAKDQFNYQIGNIQAQPYGLTKVSALNKNNKIFPFIEYYTATTEEVDYLKNFIKEKGMTVDRVGLLKDYFRSGYYISAVILDTGNEFKGSAAALLDLNTELLKGVKIIYAN